MVESNATRNSTVGDEWGWQAKYFLRAPDASQWSQIDESVRTALRSRPRLARYIVCAPVDLPAGRTGRRKSAIERWNERVQKWQGWATNRGNERRIRMVGKLRTDRPFE